MIEHTVSIHIQQPVAQVFAFVADPRNLPAWQSNLLEIEQLTPGPLRAGSQIREVRRLGRRTDENRAEVEVYAPNQRLALKTTTAPQVAIDYHFEPQPDGTRVSYGFTMQTPGLLRLLAPLIAGAIRKQSEADLERLKQLLEAPAAAPRSAAARA